ncbi:MAG TPA: ADP-forming succinate--CoA ligase subunit beta [Candidatus Polarisedimenticolia bacterium]|nr:ADP-forming succinate--CoA ligase subunit beta [Candidatus Polarisedimenticolia bacterium]
MKIHEYQAKLLLRGHGIDVPRGDVAFSPREAAAQAASLGGRVVLKAQVHAGGRGKGGGIKVAADAVEAAALAEKMIGMTLVTPQTGPQGKKVRRLLVEETLEITRELYLGITLDRARGIPMVMACAEGGMDIEEVAAKNPGAILLEPVEPLLGLRPFQARKLAYALGLEGDQVARGVGLISAMARMYEAIDASLVEINPLVVTKSGTLVALDAKMTFDDNALYRHPRIRELRDPDEEEPLEVEASAHSLNYIKLDGSVGCMVNGAGLAMATMDIIHHVGAAPANFLDVGGGASAEQVAAAFRILVADPNVKAVLINIFGGILRVDVLARGLIDAVQKVGVKVPIVVRLEGTNVDEGKRLIAEAKLNVTIADGMLDAAKKVVALAQAGTR